MVAKRKARKDEIDLPSAARENPYAYCTREELDAEWERLNAALSDVGPNSSSREELETQLGLVSEGYAWRMVRLGLGTWNGGKPKGSNPPIPVTPGPPISDYVIQDRR